MQIGLERLAENPKLAESWGRCGVLANQASLTNDFHSAWEVCARVLGKRLTALFGPQHGFFGTVQDNMIETPNQFDQAMGIPIYSLYSAVREPTAQMLENCDTLIVDLQITGTRIYTFKATVALCLQACRKLNKRLVILDRPNPIAGELVEGHVLQAKCFSFVGPHPMPMRHGLSMGEAALMFNASIGADLEILSMTGYDPKCYFPRLSRPWFLTSPNMPHFDTTVVYPGLVMLEGTNLSEGRGTCLPFQFIGAPYVTDSQVFINRIQELLPQGQQAPGLHLRPCEFMPTFQKWAGMVCRGFQIHVVDAPVVRSFDLALATMRAAMDLYGDAFQFKAPPYEYELDDLPMKFIFGAPDVAERLRENSFDLRDDYWHLGHQEYLQSLEGFLLYPRKIRSVRAP